MNLSHRGNLSIAALGPDVLSFLSACNRKLNGMSGVVFVVFFYFRFFFFISRLFSFSCLFYFIEDYSVFVFLVNRLLEEPV